MIRSVQDARLARRKLSEAQEFLDALLDDPDIRAAQEAVQGLTAALNAWVLANCQDKNDAFEEGEWRGTPVRGSTGKWNVEKLQKLVPKGIFLRLVDYVPNPDKINDAVQAGKIDKATLKKAYDITPKAPYVKWTKKTNTEDEAERLREALGE